MITTKNIGDYGEKLAENFLLEKGYAILARNYRGKSGEIDIVALQRDYIVFVEVKTRKNNLYMTARESVNPSKQKRIRSTAREYLFAYKPKYKFVRFDVIEYYTENNTIDHYVNAF